MTDMNLTHTPYRYITVTQGVAGGCPRIEGTRIAVHTIIALLQNGETVDSICSDKIYPQLTRAQIYEALSYYEDHRGPIDLLISENFHSEMDKA